MAVKVHIKAFYAESRKDWRNWLNEKHLIEKSVWLIMYHKDSKNSSVSYEDAVKEALCFGWIDSKPNKRDNESYYMFFSQRKPKSNWSKSNRERAAKLIEQGLMTMAGQKMIDLAIKTGTWTALENVQNSNIPDDLQATFDTNPKALNNFKAFPPSSKRIILEWILNAKKPETRKQRINQTAELASKNIKANHYRQ